MRCKYLIILAMFARWDCRRDPTDPPVDKLLRAVGREQDRLYEFSITVEACHG
jgi:hypothetical protein